MRITVTGVSQVRLPAECVVVSLAAGFMGPDREDVVGRTADVTTRLRSRLEDAIAGGKGRDLKLSSLRTWSSAGVNDDGEPGILQHTTEVRGTVTFDDLSVVGPLLGELASTPGIRIGNLDWRLTDDTIAERQPEVINEAFRDARQRATWIASAAGYRRVEAATIRDDGAPMFARFAAAPMARGAAATPSFDLDPEDVEVTSNLTVDFETA